MENNVSVIWLVFYGIPRAIEYTIPSIKSNLIDPLSENHVTRIAAHFFDVTSISNPRSSEFGSVNSNDASLLNPEFVEISPHDPQKIESSLIQIKIKGDKYADNFQSTRNIIQATASIKQGWELIKNHVHNDDIVIFCRPDVAYLDKVNSLCFKGADWLIPNYGAHGGINDRFIACNGRYAAEKFASTHSLIKNFCIELDEPLHAERLRLYSSIKSKTKVDTIQLKLQRIRINGANHKENFKPNSKYRPLINGFKMRAKLLLNKIRKIL